MNDEIKEILSCLNSSSWYYEANKLLEHIINLQQENERLKEQLFKSVNNTNNSMELTEDYKSRCEKASEYFKYQLENLDFYEDTKARMLCAMGITLLQNGVDKDEK